MKQYHFHRLLPLLFLLLCTCRSVHGQDTHHDDSPPPPAESNSAPAPTKQQPDCKVLNADGNDRSLMFKQYTPRETVLRELLRRSLAEVRRENRDLKELGFEIKGEDVKERVGKHIIKSTIQPSGACFVLHYVIDPVNECLAQEGTPWRHRCHETARCEDTDESYNCVCPHGFEGEQGTGGGRCGGRNTTEKCCSTSGGDACKHSFVCVRSTPIEKFDKCHGQCVPGAQCAEISAERDIWSCKCPGDLFGNGRHCARGLDPLPAVFDKDLVLQGKPTEEDFCGCQEKKIDYCIGVSCGENTFCKNGEKGHRCICEQGYVEEGGRCVDKQGVRLVLEGPEKVVLTQGDSYEDKLVRILDDNGMLTEPRYISISYDDPALNEDTLDTVGTFTISYTVKAPWTSTPTVTARRTIEVQDLDECKLIPADAKYEKWRPRCHKWATCKNTGGSYECHCMNGTVGNGADANVTRIRAEGNLPPHNVQSCSGEGQVGCVDVRPPILEVSKWEKTFRVCKCEGLNGPGSPVPAACHARDYGQELGELINAGNRICTPGWPCFKAYDKNPDGTKQDLTARVVLGTDTREEKEKREMLSDGKTEKRRFVLPISVKDDAGNKAEAQLSFSVEEVSIWDVAPPARPPASSLQQPTKELDDEEEDEEEKEATRRRDNAEKEEKRREEEEGKKQAKQAQEREQKQQEKNKAKAAFPDAEAAAAKPAPSPPSLSRQQRGLDDVKEVVEEDELEGSSFMLIIILFFFAAFTIYMCIYGGGGNGGGIGVAGGGGGDGDISLGSEDDDGPPYNVYQESPTALGRRAMSPGAAIGSPGFPGSSPRY